MTALASVRKYTPRSLIYLQATVKKGLHHHYYYNTTEQQWFFVIVPICAGEPAAFK
jgi:hypothetical protein